MFDPHAPRLFYLPPGTDFARQFAAGLLRHPPEVLARTRVYLNSERMRRRVTGALTHAGAGLLPQLRLVTELADDPVMADLPPAAPRLRRRLQLTQLIARLLDRQPGLAPRAALYDLADSLATLMDEMQGEGVDPATVAALDVSGHSEHWGRMQAFLRIVTPFFADLQDDASRQRLAAERLTAEWVINPVATPVIVAGSSGSRGATSVLMQAVAGLPQGALVLPGFDADTPAEVWAAMADALTAEDHPQYRALRLLRALGRSPADLRPWVPTPAPDPDRNKLISLSLRPAPVTDRWLVEGRSLPDLAQATRSVTLVEAPSTRIEALTIALILRDAAETGTRATLITADRTLGRQVTAALDRWGILPDDSAGAPLGLSAPGRLLRHVAALPTRSLTIDALLTLLKHPLTGSGAGRGDHLRLTRDLELSLRRHGPAFPDGGAIIAWAATRSDAETLHWARAVAAALDMARDTGPLPLTAHVARHRAVTELLARGTDADGCGSLWARDAGLAAQTLLRGLEAEASHGGTVTAQDYRDLFDALIATEDVREAARGHPGIAIVSHREAREIQADLVILGGLTDGIWPRMATPDPWLNRKMRLEAGLLLPERQIGLSAHDYQQAMGAARVVITRSLRDAEAETVPSRWLNRLFNLMNGLPDKSGPQALVAMLARGASWLMLAEALEVPTADQRADARLRPARRPQPQPPLSARPKELYLSRIATLIRDPYAIYARNILRLRPLDPLRQEADPRDRGIVVHHILRRFVETRPLTETRAEARQRLLGIAAAALAADIPFPAARTQWLARLERAADHFLTQDTRHGGMALAVEEMGRLQLGDLPFTLLGTPDRIDELPDGRLHLIDYKTGAAPTAAQQRQYEKQLLAAAALAEGGGFRDLGPAEVGLISYIGLGAGEKVEDTEMTPDLVAQVWQGLITLIRRYQQRDTGYTSRRAVFQDRIAGDYDHLARYGEWQMTDRAHPERVGGDDA